MCVIAIYGRVNSKLSSAAIQRYSYTPIAHILISTAGKACLSVIISSINYKACISMYVATYMSDYGLCVDSTNCIIFVAS